MIYVRKYAFCDGCKKILATKVVGEASTVNKELSDLLYRNGWRFDGPNRVYCPECYKTGGQHMNEPRVLTLDEVIASGDKLMWLQYKSVKTPEHYELYPTSPYKDNGERWNTGVSFQSGHVQMKGLYGKQWRCWTEKPSVADAMEW